MTTTNPTTITTDKGEIFAIEATTEAGEHVSAYGWTHLVALRRPRGRKLFSAFAVIDGGEIVRLSSVTGL